MPATQTIQVSSTVAYQSSGPDGATITVQNLGPDSCYYATAATVSSGSNDGTLASGASLSFFPSKFFISAGTSRLQVITALPGEQLRQYDNDNGQPGLYSPTSPGWNTSVASAPTALRALFSRFVPSRNMTIISMAFYVSTLGADVECDVGIYSADLQTRLGVSTAALGRLNTTGVKNIALIAPVQLQARTVYYAAWSSNTGATALITTVTTAGVGSPSLFGTAAGTVELDFKASSHPLPATLSVTGGLSSTVPLLALREV